MWRVDLKIEFVQRAVGRIATEATQARFVRDGADLLARVLDLSPRGMRVELPRPLEVGETLTVTLQHPSLPQPLELRAEVIWARRVAGQARPHAGLEFQQQGRSHTRDLGRLIALELGSRVFDGERQLGYAAATPDRAVYLYDLDVDQVAVVAPDPGRAGGFVVCQLDGGDDDPLEYRQAPGLAEAIALVFGAEHPLRTEPPLLG